MEGNCVDGDECLFSHINHGIKQSEHTRNNIEVKCGKCSKGYTNQFEVARHHWRSHEEINCNFCGKNLNSRHALKIHKEKDHNMKMNPDCKYFLEGKCVDKEECLYSHNLNSNQNTQKKTRINSKNDFCKDGLNCPRVDCEFGDDKHRRIKEVPCRFQEKCAKQECPFKHTRKTDFHKNKMFNRKI